MITIKKYGNRRLYDTERSAYVNLEDVAQRIRDGDRVRVVDAKTDDDLTRSVLVQILLETPGYLDALPPALLHRIIRTAGPDVALHPLVRAQLAAGLELLESQLAAIEAQLGWGSRPKPPPAGPGPEAAERRPTAAAEDAPADELDALRARLADLERRLGRG
jgi:polyhydroxyalkanoate synthesis repressor PhaR